MSCDSAIILLCVLVKKKFHTSSASPVLSQFSPIQLCATLWTVARHAPLSMGFSRQEYWGGLSFPLLGDLPDSGIEPMSFKSPEFAGGFFTTGVPHQSRPTGIITFLFSSSGWPCDLFLVDEP